MATAGARRPLQGSVSLETSRCQHVPDSPGGKSEMRYGYRALYLGSIPTADLTNTEMSVSLLLDRFRLGSINDEDIFLDAKICGLIMYFVDSKDKIVKTRLFDLARISYCSGDHIVDPCVFAWVYQQETRDGFRHDCHAVKTSSPNKARHLALLLNNAFTQLYHEVQAALKSSQLFHKALSAKQGHFDRQKMMSPNVEMTPRKASDDKQAQSACDDQKHNNLVDAQKLKHCDAKTRKDVDNNFKTEGMCIPMRNLSLDREKDNTDSTIDESSIDIATLDIDRHTESVSSCDSQNESVDSSDSSVFIS